MTSESEDQPGGATVVLRTFIGRQQETGEVIASLPEESQAGLRQFSLERMTGYGLDYADAVEFRARVLTGETWNQAATSLAIERLRTADSPQAAAGTATRANCIRRASALLRLSQTMMLSDTDERRATYTKAVELYRQSGELAGDRQHVGICTPLGKLGAWLIRSPAEARGSAVVIGGIEGWGMDFESLGDALAARGIDALLLDGPGQGETRFAHRAYLTAEWRDAYRAAIDYLDARAPGLPIGFVGNSMGGSLAMAIASEDRRIRACCNNGGIIAPDLVPAAGTFFSKMVAFCGLQEHQKEQAIDVWRTVTPVRQGANQGYPLLMLQGGKDPMVTMQMSQMLLDHAPTRDKQMVVFSDGDHCIYNHKQDRDYLIADWMSARLGHAASTASVH